MRKSLCVISPSSTQGRLAIKVYDLPEHLYCSSYHTFLFIDRIISHRLKLGQYLNTRWCYHPKQIVALHVYANCKLYFGDTLAIIYWNGWFTLLAIKNRYEFTIFWWKLPFLWARLKFKVYGLWKRLVLQSLSPVTSFLKFGVFSFTSYFLSIYIFFHYSRKKASA